MPRRSRAHRMIGLATEHQKNNTTATTTRVHIRDHQETTIAPSSRRLSAVMLEPYGDLRPEAGR
eukprot:1714711-Heterocapsa_arctica.AAC.1